MIATETMHKKEYLKQMKYIFLLSKENIKLAKEEVLSLFNVKGKSVDNMLFLDLEDISLSDRLAYTRKIYQFLFEADRRDLIKKINGYDWQSVYKNNFCVRIHKFNASNFKEKELASHIWRRLKKPKVDLRNPKTSIEFFIFENKIYATKLIQELEHDFESRKAHKRPELHPTALNPKLARALINLSGADKEVMDPFCGGGGILIEAGLIGLRPVGHDLYKAMLKRAKTNLNYYKIKKYKLICQDALKIKGKYDYIVTDVPYGLNTSIWVKKGNKNEKISLKQTNRKQKIENLEDFYFRFLKNLKKIMGNKAVVIFPHYVNYKKLIKKANLKLEKEFSQFVHGSLTRKIVVLS